MKIFDFFSGRDSSRQSTGALRRSQGISIVLLVLVTVTVAHSDSLFGDLPQLGQQDIRQQNRETSAGLRYLSFLNAQGMTTQDPGVTYYLEQSLLPLLPSYASDGNARDLLIFGVSHRSFNAFALPGGLIGVHDGLLEHLRETSEVQAIMAHELGHLALGHHQRLADSRRQSTGLIIASILLAPLTIQLDPNITFGMIYGAQGMAIQQQLAFSRSMEEEADRMAVGAMRAGGLPLTGFIGAYETMADIQRAQAGTTDSPYPGTHPNVRDRLSDLRNRIDQDAGSDAPAPDLPLCWVQLDRNLTVRASDQRCTDYQDVLDNPHDDRRSAWIALLEAYPANPYLIFRAVEWLESNANEQQRASMADILTEQARLIPDSWLVALSMLKLDHELSSQQRRHWRSTLFNQAPANDLTVWNTLRHAFPEEAERGRAFRAQAQSSWITGDRERAVSQLRRAVELSNASAERSRWEQQLRSWERSMER